MTEPVAYRTKDVSETLGWRYSTLKPVNKRSEPLYTAEQLHPRVKMTQAEFDEFNILKKYHSTEDLIGILRVVNSGKYINLQSRLVCSIENQVEFANLWKFCIYQYPKEIIDILPTKKWFVKSKEVQGEGNYYYLINPGQLFPLFTTNFERAGRFSTKEEAECWTNPLTEAVQLTVEEK